MKRSLSLVLALMLLFSLTAVSSAFAQEAPVTVTFQTWNPGEGSKIKDIIADFEAENPDIHVEYICMPYSDHLADLQVKLFSGEGPDVYGMNAGAPYATFSCCFNLMILKNYYDSIPNEMMEAATIDGASRWQIFFKVMMPVAKPGLAVVLMQTFLTAWNELQMVKTFITDPLRQPLSVVPIRFAQTSVASHDFTTEVLYAALVICLIPVVVFYAFAARSLVAGLTSGAGKG